MIFEIFVIEKLSEIRRYLTKATLVQMMIPDRSSIKATLFKSLIMKGNGKQFV